MNYRIAKKIIWTLLWKDRWTLAQRIEAVEIYWRRRRRFVRRQG